MTDASQHTVLGVIMLDTRFPRPPGDIGNPESFAHRVLFHTVPGASVASIVSGEALPDEVASTFIEAARSLVDQGATAITTSCGFLSPMQHAMQQALAVPVITSSLWMLPELRQRLGPRAPVAILTFDAARLSPRHIPDAGPHTIEGLCPGDHLYQVISSDMPKLDIEAARTGVMAAARRLKQRQPDLQALVLECTNLPPYRAEITQICDCEVVDIHDAIKTFANCR